MDQWRYARQYLYTSSRHFNAVVFRDISVLIAIIIFGSGTELSWYILSGFVATVFVIFILSILPSQSYILPGKFWFPIHIDLCH